MPVITLETTVDASPAQAFAVLSDWRNNIRWEQELLEYAPLTPEPLSVGSRFRWLRRVARRHTAGEVVVTEYRPPRLLVTEILEGPFHFRTLIRLEPVGRTSTRLHAQLTVHPTGPLRLLTPVLTRTISRQATANLAALRTLIESVTAAAERPASRSVESFNHEADSDPGAAAIQDERDGVKQRVRRPDDAITEGEYSPTRRGRSWSLLVAR